MDKGAKKDCNFKKGVHNFYFSSNFDAVFFFELILACSIPVDYVVLQWSM